MKNTLVVLAICGLAIVLSSCATGPTPAQIAEREAGIQAGIRRNAESIPQELAEAAAKTFAEGKTYFIWLREGVRDLTTLPTEAGKLASIQESELQFGKRRFSLAEVKVPTGSVLKIHYAISPHKQALSHPSLTMELSGYGIMSTTLSFTEINIWNLKGSGYGILYFHSRSDSFNVEISNVLPVRIIR